MPEHLVGFASSSVQVMEEEMSREERLFDVRGRVGMDEEATVGMENVGTVRCRTLSAVAQDQK